MSGQSTGGPGSTAGGEAGANEAADVMVDGGALRRALHDANGELNVAVLELELLLESADLDTAARTAVGTALGACREAAAILRHGRGTSRG